MKPKRNIALLVKILLIGGLLMVLAYLFHPDTGLFSVMIDGEPVAEPLARIAAVPTILVMLFATGILIVLAFLGAGLILFIGALLFAAVGIGLVAPFLWPLLVIVIVTIILTSLGRHDN